MKRKQIYLDEKSDTGLKNLAYSRGVSEAFLVREAVAEYLVSNAPKPVKSKKGRRDDNPLWKLLDLAVDGVEDDNGPTDMAENHDHYLYGLFMRKK